MYQINLFDYTPGEKPIDLGHQGEDKAYCLIADLAEFKEKFGEGIWQFWYRRPDEVDWYLAENTYEIEDTAVWILSKTNTANYGEGRVELRYFDAETEEFLAKTDVYAFYLKASPQNNSGDAPSPAESLIDEISKIWAQIQQAENEASGYANAAAQSASEAEQYASNAADSASNAASTVQQASAETLEQAQGYASQAEASASSAAQNAAASRTSENNAASSATQASGYANAAAQSASEAFSGTPTGYQSLVQNVNNLSNTVIQIQDFIGYNDEDIVGVEVDYENKTYTRLSAAAGKNAGTDFDAFPTFGGAKRCNVANDGTINAYYGDEGFVEDGSNGQVMVYQPKYWYKVVPLKLEPQSDGIGYHCRKAAYYVSHTYKPGFKVHPAFIDPNGNEVDYYLIGAYEASIYDISASAYLEKDEQIMAVAEDLLCSIAGVKPASGRTQQFTRPNVETMAQNRGKNWHGLTIQVISSEQLLMLIELAGNFQTVLGAGVTGVSDSPNTTNNSSYTGSTSSLGNSSGKANMTVNERDGVDYEYTGASQVSISWRGRENLYGNIWKFVYGINIYGNGSMKAGMAYICSDMQFAENKNSGNYKPVGFTLANANGYISCFGYGDPEFDWVFLASETAGNSSLPIGDYHYLTANLNGYRVAFLGGYWSGGANAGGFFWRLNYSVGTRNRYIGGRAVYIPEKAV